MGQALHLQLQEMVHICGATMHHGSHHCRPKHHDDVHRYSNRSQWLYNSAQAVVTVTPLPASGLNGPNEICMDEYAVFNASPLVAGATYAWSFDGGTSLDGDANDPSESIKWSSAYQNMSRTVTLTVSKDNCSNTYTKAILVKTGVILNTQDNYPVCQGGTVTNRPQPE
jgi:hypothetical protein